MRALIMRSSVLVLLGVSLTACALPAVAQDSLSRFEVEIEGGPVWQSRNDVEIPNDGSATRFSIVDLVGSGPWFGGRLYFTWNINRRHGLRALLAPLSITADGTPATPVDFAGATFAAGVTTGATYKFNSWRLTYRYGLTDQARWKIGIGFTAKIRDAKIALSQPGVAAEKTDVGFVPLLHVDVAYKFSPTWRLLLDVDALAGGPGRAEDLSLKVAYVPAPRWRIAAGYRTVEGGADVEEVYNFAWLHYAVVSAAYSF